MEVNLGGFIFFSNFDSGNLGRIALAADDEEEAKSEQPSSLAAKPRRRRRRPPSQDAQPTPTPPEASQTPDLELNVWTKPDCQGTEFENGNRTWFFFGVRRDPKAPVSVQATYLLRFKVKNLNKQSKLFSQGMCPVYVTGPPPKAKLPCRPPPISQGQWQRIKSRPTYATEDSNFTISFTAPVESRTVTYLAFTYPYTYRELQTMLGRVEKKYGCADKSYAELAERPTNSIYWHRELACFSREKRRLDLITLTAINGITDQREDELENLFPDLTGQAKASSSSSKDSSPGPSEEEIGGINRPFTFPEKKIVFVSARVHPGETQSSFVFNGFLKFLLRENDPRSIALRRKYVFKLLPMLNPDGVVNGHYRTDNRGVNLNRIYGSPSLEYHPTIYAARKLVLYSHYGYEIKEKADAETKSADFDETSLPTAPNSHWLRSSSFAPPEISPVKPSLSLDMPAWYEMTETSRCSEGDESIADFSIHQSMHGEAASSASSSPATAPSPLTSFQGAFSAKRKLETMPPPSVIPSTSSAFNPILADEMANIDFAQKLDNTLVAKKAEEERLNAASPTQRNGHEGVFVYVDIHGHASKRGIFMYGNHFRDLDRKVESMLLPKLMSLNCANFDFPACNFTERNMYMKDRHTGAGKDGSGRVAVYKATGMTHSFTLECNFNSGRVVNQIAPASRDSRRATPPPNFDHPPTYDTDTYEDAGKAMGAAILDLTESNPWTRLTSSSCRNLNGVRESIKKYIKQNERESKKKSQPSETQSSRPSLASPARRTRRLRTPSSGSPKKGLKLKAVGSTNAPAPSSPDNYCPVTKAAKKNLFGKNSQSGGTSSAAGVTKRTASTSLKRSRSIPGTSNAHASALPTSLQERTPAVLRSAKSQPNSRPSSPTRRRSNSVVLKKKVGGKKKQLSRKVSDASSIASSIAAELLESSSTSPSRSAKVGKKKRKKIA